ncbi:MAG: hypothetical protein HZC42_12630 [Candidatus Eisenbacteria bacterium]|nr:hypothetical protein [Candidatus Eisenbacteria bacterium]
MTDIAAALGDPSFIAVSGYDSASYELRFMGMITTESGARKQNLYETLVRPGQPIAVATSRPGEAAFLTQLWRARPDLRPRLAARVPPAGMLADTSHTYASTFLHGYAWEKTARWIGTYGDLDTLLAWKYLGADLWPGSQFTHQLVPALASDIFLYGRILPPRSVRTPAGTFRSATVCAYLVDFGVSALTDSSGNLVGYTRYYSYARVWYVDGTGPVACYERSLLTVGGDPTGYGDITLGLTSLPPVLWARRAW